MRLKKNGELRGFFVYGPRFKPVPSHNTSHMRYSLSRLHCVGRVLVLCFSAEHIYDNTKVVGRNFVKLGEVLPIPCHERSNEKTRNSSTLSLTSRAGA